MKVKALRDFCSMTYGNVDKGQFLDLTPQHAKQLSVYGMVEVVGEGDGEAAAVPPIVPPAPSSASPVGQVSPQTTATKSATGVSKSKIKKRGR